VARQRLELEEPLGEHLQLVALGGEDVVGFLIARLDQPPDLRIDLLGGRLRNVLLLRPRVAEKDVLARRPILRRTEAEALATIWLAGAAEEILEWRTTKRIIPVELGIVAIRIHPDFH
jgi:hypothetical protein